MAKRSSLKKKESNFERVENNRKLGEFKVEDGKITLVWMDKLRERLRAEREGLGIIGMTYGGLDIIAEFIDPVFEYGMGIEKRLTEEYEKKRRKLTDKAIQ
jgi:hypothetical protein